MFQSKYKVKESSTKKAYNYLINLIAKRDYSEYKLREKLRLKGYESSHIDESIQKLIDDGYLREDFYTDARIRGLMSKNYSPSHIKRSLEQEKIYVDESYILSIFGDNYTSVDDQVDYLVSKKIGSKPIPEGREEFYKFKNKIITFIVSKGHSFSAASDAFNRYLDKTD
ncbi:regulatory protein RecX [Halobacteriovorax sp. GB3]|uniref:regulatory protein RecX n=1 Tax=Halobacteriovorax sp. GB3 TaxID=2719615 RepID=UPI0023630FB4|nr:regulatory protein RecX [Halobacteriovorax sp. GB3]MDD0854576.1 regulatory protein RecX [Halobacteriovorax sp. GB3]